MIAVSLSIALVFTVLALTRRTAGAALGIVVLSMLFWPEYLRIPVGLADMSVPRLVGLALLLKYMSRGVHHRINSNRIDALVILLWLWTVFATAVAGASFSYIAQMIGRGFDTVLMYLVARMSLLDEGDARGFRVWIVVTAICMGLLGVYEALTASSPYQSLIQYRSWSWIDKPPEFRLGMLRAQASTSVSIYFGMSMVLVLGMLIALRSYADSVLCQRLAVLAAALAALSSLSSGPWLACAMLALFVLYERIPTLIRPSLWLVLALALTLEVVSNRHFYHLVDYLALNSATAWYRTRLIEVAITQWRDFWLVGVGAAWPHHWADYIDGRGHIDVVNHFLITALLGGVPAMLMYIATHVIAVRRAIHKWRDEADTARRTLLFGLVATLIALDLSTMSVGLFGPSLLLSHIVLGLMVSASDSWNQSSKSYVAEELPSATASELANLATRLPTKESI